MHDERKQMQLAAQIGRSIEMTLVGECEDEVLQNLSVQSVEPATGNRMLVTLEVHPPGSERPREEVLALLESARPLIVRRATEDVSRRSLPELSFWVVLAAEGDGEPTAPDDEPSPA